MRTMRMHHMGILFTSSSFALGVTIPVLSLLLLEKGLNLSTLALAMGAYSIVVVASEIPSGIIGDKYGRKSCFILAKLFTAAGSILLVSARSPFVFVCAILLMGLARAFISGSFEALAIDWHNQRFGTESLHRITTWISIWETVGLSAGALAAGFVTIWSGKLIHLQGTYDGNFLLSAIANGVIVVLAWMWIDEPAQQMSEQETEIGFRPLMQHIRSNRLLAVLMGGSIATGFLLSSIEKYWQPRLVVITNGTEKATVFLGVLAFIGFMGALAGTAISGRIIAIHKRSVLLQFTLWRLGMVVAVAALSRSMSALGYGALYGVFYVCLGLSGIAEQVMLNRLIPAYLRATLLSSASFALQAGGLAASGFAALWLADRQEGISSLWLISAMIILISVIPIFVKFNASKQLLDT